MIQNNNFYEALAQCAQEIPAIPAGTKAHRFSRVYRKKENALLRRLAKLDRQSMTSQEKRRHRFKVAGAFAATAAAAAIVGTAGVQYITAHPNILAAVGMGTFNAYDLVFYYREHSGWLIMDENWQAEAGYDDWNEYEEMLRANNFGGAYPYFGNPLIFGGSDLKAAGDAFDRTEHVYMALYDPLVFYSWKLTREYKNLIRMDYTVDVTDTAITVDYNNTAYPDGLDGDPIYFSRTFVFDITDVSLTNIPRLDDESIAFIDPIYREYLGEARGYEEVYANYSAIYEKYLEKHR